MSAEMGEWMSKFEDAVDEYAMTACYGMDTAGAVLKWCCEWAGEAFIYTIGTMLLVPMFPFWCLGKLRGDRN